MKVTLYMAVSIDGFIAKTDMSTNWIFKTDFKILDEKIDKHGCVILGHTTFKEFGETSGVVNIVITHTPKENKPSLYYVSSPKEAIDLCNQLNIQSPLIIGGGIVNGSFLRENLIDELILSMHPIILGKGIKVFENTEIQKNITYNKIVELQDGLNQLYYSIKK